MNNELEKLRNELSNISIWVQEFAKDSTEGPFLCVLRLLAAYREVKTIEAEEAIAKQVEQNDTHRNL
jgi:hypothetical protein